MRVLLFGASGMIGGGVLTECLEDDRVEEVCSVVRTGTRRSHAKLTEVVHADLFDPAPISDRLVGFDACFYCVGVTSVGLGEDAYRRLTVELTKALLDPVVEANSGVTLVFVSGQGTDDSERGGVMWARVKGEAENYVRGLSARSYLFRPGFIQPKKGARPKTRMYRVLYALLTPIIPLLRIVFPNAITTTVEVGRAMLHVVDEGWEHQTLEQRDIVAAARV